MTYRKLLELYKAGELSEDEAETISRDIERQEAIGEYLCETAETFDIALPEELPAEEAADFAKLISRSIRRAFVKLGLVVLVLALVMILFIQFALPKIVASFYYNPAEIVAGKGTDMEISRMSRDLAVYSELALPGQFRDTVYVSDLGYGDYEISIPQTASFTNGRFSSVSGKMEKGKLTLYDTNILKAPYGNIFYWYYVQVNAPGSTLTDKPLSSLLTEENSYWHNESSQAEVSRMSDSFRTMTFITLKKQMKYEDFITWTKQQGLDSEIWCVPVNLADRFSENLGFRYRPGSSTSVAKDTESYPNLFLWRTDISEPDYDAMQKNMNKESFMKEHYVSMLRYMADQDQFLNTSSEFSLSINQHPYDEIADYIEEHGLVIIGFAAAMTKETAQKLLQDDQVYGINIQDQI